MKINKGKIVMVLAVGALIGLFYFYDLGRYLTLDFIKENQNNFQEYYSQNRVVTILTYIGIYILATALSLPGATILTLGAGALFGTILGTFIVSISSTVGATCAFLVARYLFRESLLGRFGDRLRVIDEGIKKEGAFYLFSLRLIPIFPFFLINILMGLTPIKIGVYFFVSMIGMFPGTIVYVNAGTQLAKIDSLGNIASPTLIGSFVLLGLFPLLAKKILPLIRKQVIRK